MAERHAQLAERAVQVDAELVGQTQDLALTELDHHHRLAQG